MRRLGVESRFRYLPRRSTRKNRALCFASSCGACTALCGDRRGRCAKTRVFRNDFGTPGQACEDRGVYAQKWYPESTFIARARKSHELSTEVAQRTLRSKTCAKKFLQRSLPIEPFAQTDLRSEPCANITYRQRVRADTARLGEGVQLQAT